MLHSVPCVRMQRSLSQLSALLSSEVCGCAGVRQWMALSSKLTASGPCHGALRQRGCAALQVKRFTQVTGIFKALLAKQPQWPALPWHVTDDAAVIPPGLASLPADEARRAAMPSVQCPALPSSERASVCSYTGVCCQGNAVRRWDCLFGSVNISYLTKK